MKNKNIKAMVVIVALALSGCGGESDSGGPEPTRVKIVDIVFTDSALQDCVVDAGLEYADEVEDLDCGFVSDADGIEFLVGLKTLNLDSSLLTALDVSANTALVNLNVRGNQLTALDVSANTALMTLRIDSGVNCTGAACP